jgi:hypothetical protein
MFLSGFGGLQMIFIVCTTCCQHLKIRALSMTSTRH